MQRAWLGGVMVVALLGCSLSLDLTECATDDDCSESLICTAEGYCATEHSAYTGPQFQSPECEAIHGPAYSEDTILLGAVLPLTGSTPQGGLQMEQAVVMAVDAFNANEGLLPGGRSLAVVLCDSGGKPERGVKAAHHLLSLGVLAVIGPAVDAVALAVAAEVGVANAALGKSGMLLMSPAATHPSLSSADAEGGDLVWRATPSVQVQIDAIRTMLADPTAHGLPAEIERLAVAYNVDDELSASEHVQALEAALIANPLPGLSVEEIAWIEYLPSQQAEWVHQPTQQLILEDPDVTLVFGGTEVPQLIAWLEAIWYSAPFGCDRPDDRNWDTDVDGKVDPGQVLANLRCSRLKSLGTPPHWLLGQGDMQENIQSQIISYSTYCVTKSPDGQECLVEGETFGIEAALGRVLGTTQGEGDGAALSTFRERFEAVHGQPVLPASFAAHAWDATHLLALGIAAALEQGETPLDASEIAKGLRLLQAGTSVSLSDDEAAISAALATLAFDGQINVEGASGALDFNGAGEPATGAVHRWRPLLTPGSFLLTPVLNGNGTVHLP